MNKHFKTSWIILGLFVILFLGFAQASLIDGFEDGDYTTNPVWTVADTGGGTISVQSGTVKDGTYALKLVTDGANDNANIQLRTNYDFLSNDNNELSAWIRVNDIVHTGNSHRFSILDSGNTLIGFCGIFNSQFQFDTANDTESTAGSPSADTWYEFRLNFNDIANSMDCNIYDGGGTLVQNFTPKTANASPAKIEFRVQDVKASAMEYYVDLIYDNNSTIPLVGITADFNSKVNINSETDANIEFTDTTTNDNPSELVTINDWNWYVDTVLKSTDQNYTLTSVLPNTDYNIALEVCGDYGGTPYCSYKEENVNSGKFYGLLHIDMTNENTKADLTGTTITFDGNTYTANGDWWHDLNYLGATNTEETIQISLSGYGTRYYTADFNRYGDYNIPFMMLPSTLDDVGNTELRVYDSDGLNLVTNTFVTVTLDNNYIGRRKTDTSGDVTFFLDETDANYIFSISGEYDTNLGLVLINRPRIENTEAVITGEDWTMTIKSQNADTNYLGIATESQSILLIPNQKYYNSITIDTNTGNYSPRKYIAQLKGDRDGKTLTIQPYLILDTDATSYKITIKEKYTELLLDYAIVEVHSTAQGDTKLITSFQTDVGAENEIWLYASETYYFEMSDKLGVSRTVAGEPRGMINTITGEDITLYVDYSVVRGKDIVPDIHAPNIYNDVNTVVSILADSYIMCRLSLNGWTVSQSCDAYTIETRVYVNGTLNTSLGDTEIISSNTAGFADYDYNFLMGQYDSNYTIVVLIDGTEVKRQTYYTISETEAGNIWQFAVSENLTQFLIIVIVLTMSIFIGFLTDYGLETLFILCIMLTFTGLMPYGITLVAVLGAIYFVAPTIKDWYKE